MNNDYNNFNQSNNNGFNPQQSSKIYQQPVSQMGDLVHQPVKPQSQLMPQQPIQNNYNMNTQPTNNTPKKKSNIGLIIGIVVAVIIVILIIVLVLKLNKKTNTNPDNSETNVNTNKKVEFDDDVILNHVTVHGVKLSEINTLQDALDKFNAKISSVSVCYRATEEEEGCPTYSYDQFLSNSVSKEGISSVDFVVSDYTNYNGQPIVTFSASYKLFKTQKTNVQYFRLLVEDLGYNVKLDEQTLREVSYDEIKSKFTLDPTSNEYSYNIKFKSKDGDEYTYSGTPNSNFIHIFNTSQRDRGL